VRGAKHDDPVDRSAMVGRHWNPNLPTFDL
jgi:hypothetical protein